MVDVDVRIVMSVIGAESASKAKAVLNAVKENLTQMTTVSNKLSKTLAQLEKAEKSVNNAVFQGGEQTKKSAFYESQRKQALERTGPVLKTHLQQMQGVAKWTFRTRERIFQATIGLNLFSQAIVSTAATLKILTNIMIKFASAEKQKQLRTAWDNLMTSMVGTTDFLVDVIIKIIEGFESAVRIARVLIIPIKGVALLMWDIAKAVATIVGTLGKVATIAALPIAAGALALGMPATATLALGVGTVGAIAGGGSMVANSLLGSNLRPELRPNIDPTQDEREKDFERISKKAERSEERLWQLRLQNENAVGKIDSKIRRTTQNLEKSVEFIDDMRSKYGHLNRIEAARFINSLNEIEALESEITKEMIEQLEKSKAVAAVTSLFAGVMKIYDFDLKKIAKTMKLLNRDVKTHLDTIKDVNEEISKVMKFELVGEKASKDEIKALETRALGLKIAIKEVEIQSKDTSEAINETFSTFSDWQKTVKETVAEFIKQGAATGTNVTNIVSKLQGQLLAGTMESTKEVTQETSKLNDELSEIEEKRSLAALIHQRDFGQTRNSILELARTMQEETPIMIKNEEEFLAIFKPLIDKLGEEEEALEGVRDKIEEKRKEQEGIRDVIDDYNILLSQQALAAYDASQAEFALAEGLREHAGAFNELWSTITEKFGDQNLIMGIGPDGQLQLGMTGRGAVSGDIQAVNEAIKERATTAGITGDIDFATVVGGVQLDFWEEVSKAPGRLMNLLLSIAGGANLEEFTSNQLANPPASTAAGQIVNIYNTEGVNDMIEMGQGTSTGQRANIEAETQGTIWLN